LCVNTTGNITGLRVGDSAPGERDLEDGIARGEEELPAGASCGACHFIVIDFGQDEPAFLSRLFHSRIAKTIPRLTISLIVGELRALFTLGDFSQIAEKSVNP
jgi:hypothetical protein